MRTINYFLSATAKFLGVSPPLTSGAAGPFRASLRSALRALAPLQAPHAVAGFPSSGPGDMLRTTRVRGPQGATAGSRAQHRANSEPAGARPRPSGRGHARLTSLLNGFLFIGLLVILSGCGDGFFELERPPQNPWTTLEEFERAPIGAYGILFSDREWVQAYPNYAVIITSLGDDVAYVSDDQWGYLRRTEEGTDMTERNIWILYRGIGAVNAALDYVDENDGNPFPEASRSDVENNLNRIIGELHFLRGYCYFLLQTTYGTAYVPGGANSEIDLPIHTKFPTSAEEATNPFMGTTQEMWDQIMSDLRTAKDLLPTAYVAGLHHPSYEVRANRFAAAGMLMRASMQLGDYAAAKTEADYLLDDNGGAYDLSEDPIAAFDKSGYAERGRETIWYLPYSDQTLYPPSHLSVLNATWNGNKCRWNETRMALPTVKRLGWMTSPETDTTINAAARRDKRFQQLTRVRYPVSQARPVQETDDRPELAGLTSIWPFKYYRGPNEDFTNLPLLRLAEVYLTRSVINFRAGNTAAAAADLNTVRRRAWDESVGGPYEEISAAALTEQAINDERLIELFNEADRVNYLRALKVDIPRGERGPGTDPYTSEKFVWTIPDSETLYNEFFKDL